MFRIEIMPDVLNGTLDVLNGDNARWSKWR